MRDMYTARTQYAHFCSSVNASRQITYVVLNALNMFTHLVSVCLCLCAYYYCFTSFDFISLGLFCLLFRCLRICARTRPFFFLSSMQQIIPQALIFALIFLLIYGVDSCFVVC